MFGEKPTIRRLGRHRHQEAPKREAPGMHPVHTKWWPRMHRVHTELVGPAPGEMRWDNCFSEFFLFDQGYNSKSIIV